MSLKIVSKDGLGANTQVYIDGKKAEGLVLSAILFEGGELNTAWLKVEGVELDLDGVAEGDLRPIQESWLRRIGRRIDALESQVMEAVRKSADGEFTTAEKAKALEHFCNVAMPALNSFPWAQRAVEELLEDLKRTGAG